MGTASMFLVEVKSVIDDSTSSCLWYLRHVHSGLPLVMRQHAAGYKSSKFSMGLIPVILASPLFPIVLARSEVGIMIIRTC